MTRQRSKQRKAGHVNLPTQNETKQKNQWENRRMEERDQIEMTNET